jgi:hypothetical protein
MAITKALMYARVSSSTSTGTGLYKKLRVGASRLNFFGPKQILSINGTLRTNSFDRLSWAVTDRGRGQGKTLSIEVFGFTPAVGQSIILGAGSLWNYLFVGTITRVRQTRRTLNDGRVVYALTCADAVYDLGALKVTARYASESATTIATDLISSFATGFTSVHVQPGLATLDEIQFTMQTLPSALQQLCDRIGGAWYIDDLQDLHLYVGSETVAANPETITENNKHLRSGFTYEADIEGLKNRVLVEGRGSTVTTPVTAGFTSIPVEDVSMFQESGGEVKLEARRCTYTGKSAMDGEGSLTAGTPGSAPTSPSPAHVAPYVTGNLVTGGTYRYIVTFVSALGESASSAAVGASIAAVLSSVTDAPSSVTGTTGGSLNSGGSYVYAVTFVTASGEVGHTTAGLSFWSLGTGNTKALLSGIPVSSDARVTARRIYRTTSGGAGTLKLVATIGDNVTTTYADTLADASLGVAMPDADTGSTGKLTVGIPLGPTGTTSRKLYRSVLGGATYKLQSTTADNTTTSLLDNTADGSLGANFSGSTLGASAGDTTLRVSDLSKFPDGGWLRVGSQVLFFTARGATSGEGDLTGIPASGTGAITASIPAGSTVVGEPHLTGVPASGAGAVTSTIAQGSTINLLVTVNDLTSQGLYGIREDFAQDRRLSYEGASDLAAARLALLKDPRVTIANLTSSDPKLGAGRPVSISHGTWGLTASVVVQTVTIKPSQDRPQPMLSAQLGSRSLDDLYAQLREIREQLAR